MTPTAGPATPTPGDEAEVHHFRDLGGHEYTDPDQHAKQLKNHIDELSVKLQQRRVEDAEQRLRERPKMTRQLLLLLVFQNFAVFALVIGKSWLELDPMVLSIIVPATLGETAFMVHKIVDFAFREIDYKPHENGKIS